MLFKLIELSYSVLVRIVSHYAIIIIDKWLSRQQKKQKPSDSKDDK